MAVALVGYRMWYADGTVAAGDIRGLSIAQIDTLFQNIVGTGVVCMALYTDQTYQIDRGSGPVTENYYFRFLGARGGQVNLSAATMADMLPVRRDQVDWYWFDSVAGQFGAGLLSDIPETISIALRKEGTLLPDLDFFAIYNVAKEVRVSP